MTISIFISAMSRHVSEKIVSCFMLHAAQKNCLAVVRKTTQRHCGHNLSQFCDSFFHVVHEKWAEKSKKTQRERPQPNLANLWTPLLENCLDRKVLSEKIPRLQKFIGKTLKVNLRFRDYCLVKYCVNTNCKIFYFSEPRNGTSPAERN